jgi:tryptophan 2,3-dioxygenase
MPFILACGHSVADQHQVHYCDYLRLNELLQLQPPAEQLHHPDEQLFITTHQNIELWLKQILWELQRCIEALDADNTGLAIWLMRRINRITALLIPTLQLLDTMAPSDFFDFRPYLAPASGAESQQFRALELLVGVRDPAYRQYLDRRAVESMPDHPTHFWTERLSALWNSRSLSVALTDLLQRRDVTPEELYVVAPQQNPHADLFLLVEELLDFDESMVLWRTMHARIVERAIGPHLSGTGHSSGVAYLESGAAKRRFFPHLWHVRTHLWAQRVQDASLPSYTQPSSCPITSFPSAPEPAHE